jgi:hypothetical protein
MIYNYLESLKSQKILILCVFILFISTYVFDRINITLKGIFGIFIGLIICWYFIDKKITIKNENKELISKIVNELPILKELEDEEELILFYYNNKTLIDYDIINFDNSILNSINFIKVFKRIDIDSDLAHYQFDVLEKHRYLCLEYFRQIEYNIPNQKNIINYMKENLDLLSSILNKYLNKNIKKLSHDKYDIHYKFINKSKVKEFNKYDYII